VGRHTNAPRHPEPERKSRPRDSARRAFVGATLGLGSPYVSCTRYFGGKSARFTSSSRYFHVMLVVKEDAEKARQYAIMRRRATALLAGFAVLFVVVSVFIHLRPDVAPF